MKKSIIAMSLFALISTTAASVQASEPKNWCDKFMAHAEVLMVPEQLSSKMGKTPEDIPSEDARAYRKLIARGRRIMRRYPTLEKRILLNILGSDCEDIYNPTRNGKL